MGQTTMEMGSHYTMQDLAADALALLQHLDLRKVNVVGCSMGGAIAQLMAAAEPEQIERLVISNSTYRFNPVTTHAFQAMLGLYELGIPMQKIMATLIPWNFSANYLENNDAKNFLKELVAPPSNDEVTSLGRRLQALYNFDSRACPNKIISPTLVVSSEKDLITPPDESHFLSERIKKATHLNFGAYGHAAFMECSDRFCAEIMRFF